MATKSQQAKRPAAAIRLETERTQFKSLIALNPNYFGNLVASPFKPVKKIVGNTFYEQLTCVGYSDKLGRLEAHVLIKQPFGYKGNLCQTGGTEYVRFFVNYGSGWDDAGVVSFQAHNIPNSLDCADKADKPLAYVASLQFTPKRDRCGNPVMPNVRAILSYEALPTPGDENYAPVWGNVVNQHIQIPPRRRIIDDLVAEIGDSIGQVIKLPPHYEAVADLPIPLPDPDPLSLGQLVEAYAFTNRAGRRDFKVAPHRFAAPAVQAVVSNVALDQAALPAMFTQFEKLGLNWADIVAVLDKTKADVSFEELECLGLDRNHEWLAATFRVKKPQGYSGDLCGPGSLEHVAFWADWDDTCEWTYLGTVSTRVHDIAAIPADGLAYTALLPVNLNAYRRPCNQPKVARIRAVLSWSSLPSTTDPDDLNTWGNRLDAHVEIKPGFATGKANIAIIGGIGIDDINVFGNGMTQPGAHFAFNGADADPYDTTRSCAFGGQIVINGLPSVGDKYRVLVRKMSDPTNEIVLNNAILTTDSNGVSVWRNPVGGFFNYLDVSQNILNTLAYWYSTGDELWEVRLEVYNAANVLLDWTPWYNVQLDNTDPVAQLTLNGGACNDFADGSTLTGTFIARDLRFGHYALAVKPASINPNSTTPSSGIAQTPLFGSPWSLDTQNPNDMTPCGYVIELHVYDNTIVGSQSGSHNYAYDDVGFCLS
jgi:hypothetical protein